MHNYSRDKLAPVKLNRYKDDILFFMFYTNVGDVLQLAAAAELYNRDWRYHKVISCFIFTLFKIPGPLLVFVE
jgi:CCR4-NOT transcriptional regulation complex NOT5 subunit